MSTDVEISIAADGGASGKALEQEAVETASDRDAKDKLASPLCNVIEISTSDSGVSNASSLTSDCPVPLNNGDIHELTKTVYVVGHTATGEKTSGDLPTRSRSTPQTKVSRFEVVDVEEHSSLLGVSETERGLSMLSLEVMTSGDQLNLIAEGLSDSEGSVGTSRSLSPDVEEERNKEGDCGGVGVSPSPTAESGTGQSPSDGSRCSSSMGYLEPRPRAGTEEDPKLVQRKLLETVQTLTTADDSGGSGSNGRGGLHVGSQSSTASPEPPSQSLSAPPSSAVSRSHSSQSLKTEAGSSGSRGRSLSSFFRRKKMSYVGSADHTSQTLLAATSTTGLILQDRPSNLPAKSAAEERRHQRMYEQMVAAARKKELEKAKQVVKKEEERRSKDKMVADSLKEWSKILPKWDSMHKTRKVRELWWFGLPPGVRGEVWKRALGNDLNISPDLYLINLRRCRERLESLDQRGRSDSGASQKSLSREQSVEVIHLDVLRTFPTLGFFQEGGPYHQTLHDVLGAYACYRPDIGYVQGMSFLAAVLLLNMEAADAFISLANLLNRSSYLAFFRVDHTLMRPYFDSFNIFIHDFMPKLSAHFEQLQFSPEYYLIEWIFTIYTRTLPLDIACRVWDMFCRDGDSFLFRTALGILRLYQSELLQFYAIEDAGQFLGKLPVDISSETLFGCIEATHLTPKRFDQVVQSKMNGPSR